MSYLDSDISFAERLKRLVDERLEDLSLPVTLEFSASHLDLCSKMILKEQARLKDTLYYLHISWCSTCHKHNPESPMHVEILRRDDN